MIYPPCRCRFIGSENGIFVCRFSFRYFLFSIDLYVVTSVKWKQAILLTYCNSVISGALILD